MNHYVYEITNLVNGKKYIGKRSCKCPIEEDKYMGSGKLIKKAHKKYGIENFKKNVLYICESDALAYAKEKELIESVEAWNNDMYYNLDGGGRGTGSGKAHPMYGTHLSEDRKEKLRQINLGKKLTEETKKKISLKFTGSNHPLYGKKHTEETKRKIGNFHKGNKWALGVTRSEETKRKMSDAKKGNTYFLGKKHTEEAKIKIGLSSKGRNAGCNNYMYGKTHTDEARKKISIANTGRKSVNRKSVILINNYMIFDCMRDAQKFLGLSSYTGISLCCSGKRKSAGKINGEPARWMYYDDYLKQQGGIKVKQIKE